MISNQKQIRLWHNFAGVWAFSRFVNGVKTYIGKREYISATDTRYNVIEFAEMVGNHQTLRAQTRFIYRNQEDGIGIYFNSHRKGLYVLLQTDGEHWTGEHVCPPDIYSKDLQFSSQDRFKTLTRISGPKKLQKIETEYKRIG